jgi:predicted RNase H-like HicB family nuclease
VTYLKRHADQPLSMLNLIGRGKKVFALTDDPSKLVEATASGQVVLTISVESLARHLEQGVTRISAPLAVAVRVRGRAYQAVFTPDLEVGGYSVEVPELPGCITEGDDLAEAKRMTKDAIDVWLSVAEPHKASGRSRPG